jgi:hypothetical protein
MEDGVVAAASEQSQPKPLLFISHKHSDKPIADVIHDFVRDRSGDRVRVFQSSSASAEGPRLGRNLTQELADALWEASMVILVYTSPDHDWSYCMWECGVATDPRSPDTRPVLFQCGDERPDVFAGSLGVDTRDLSQVQRFVNDFLTRPNFFPGHRRPITEFPPNSDFVKQAGQAFYTKLEEVIPRGEARILEESWPYPFLRLELSKEEVERIRAESFERRVATTTEAVLESQVIESDFELRRIFGRAGLPSQAKFRVLVDGWREKFRQSEPAWLEALSEQVSAAVLGRFPTLRWELMRGMDDYDGTLYAPVVNYACTLGGLRQMQFDVYFDKFELKEGAMDIKVGIPPMPQPSRSPGGQP